MDEINGLNFFNGTPHSCRFEVGSEVVEVPPDELINARPLEAKVSGGPPGVQFVTTKFVGDEAGREVIARARAAGANIILGSIIAAQAYPGDVVAMVPAPGYERVPPAEKRMRADKFTVFTP